MDRSRASKFGASGDEVRRGSDSIAARLMGSLRSFCAGAEGNWWRNEVRMWEFLTVTGSSVKMSW